jgi:acyl CoA:acetate/3-ketoacid CoA transferase beta subunit
MERVAKQRTNTLTEFTIDELMSVCIAKQVRDGELLAIGINTPLVLAGYMLAKRTHAPRVRFTAAIGQGISQEFAPLSVARIEDSWLKTTLDHYGFVSGAVDMLPAYKLKEFFRPAQIDADGNFNNIAFGSDYTRPRMRLPGSGGIPDVTVFSDQIHLYVPRHSRITFVEQVDFVTGLGHMPQRKVGSGARYLISDLGQFDWHEGKMRLKTLHPGVTLERVQAKTGFPLQIADDLIITPHPTEEAIRLLREEIDPLNVRKLEMLAGSARKELLRTILQRENAW